MGEVYYLKNPNNPPVAIGTIQKVGGVWEYYISNPNQSPLKVSKSLWISQFLEGNMAQPLRIPAFYSRATDLEEGTLNPAYQVEGNLYQLRIKSNIILNIPSWITDKLRVTLKKVGWLLSNIHIEGNEYVLELEKVSSISFAGLVAIVVSVLALAGIIAISWTLIRLSDNKIEMQTTSSNQLQDFLTYVDTNPDLPPEDKAEILKNISENYDFNGNSGTGDNDNNNGLNLTDISNIALILIVGLIAYNISK